MSDDENDPSPGSSSRKYSGSALHMGPHKKAASSNPLVLHGRHFGWTVFALCNYPSLLTGGILQLEELQDSCIEDYPVEVFMELVDSYPSLLEHLTAGEEEDVIHVGELMGKGVSGARGDDTKTLKSAVLEWLVPRGQPLILPLSRNIKSDHGFNHEVTGALLCPADLDWSNPEHIYDPGAPWQGLLRSKILVCGFKHVFTSPSSVEKDPKATRSGNAYLHGMKLVTKGSLAYIVTQVRFSLSSSSVFSHTDTVTDSKIFIIVFLTSWRILMKLNCIFPNSSSSQWSISKNSVLSKIREKCAALLARADASAN
ncbi:hypothetical protein F4604DRAFT_1684100 [Suillus subluteus]|nr:hypothetical protein F4604DRAFT_1684100 [Suillus subluteus]